MPDVANLLEKVNQAYQAGRWAEAERWLRQVLQSDSENVHYHFILGELQRLQGQGDAALKTYHYTVERAPHHHKAHFRLAVMLRERGAFAKAVQHFEVVIALQPDHQQAHLQLGNLLLERWSLTEAITVYRQLLTFAPDQADAHHNLGLALVRSNEYAAAVPHLKRALELRPGWLTAHHILGLAQAELGQVKAARQTFAPVLAGPAGNFAMRLHVETLGRPVPRSRAAIDAYLAELQQQLEHSVAAIADQPDLVRTLTDTQLYDANAGPPFFLSYYGRNLKPILAKWGAIFQPRFAAIQAQTAAIKRSDRRPHIGFVVTPGHEGTFLTDRLGVVNRLDGEQFQLHIFCAAAAQARIARRLTNPAVVLQPCMPELGPMSTTIGQAGCDILCFWECGTDTLNYFLPFYRLAAIQCLDWGTPYTSGVPAMDYYISSERLEPADGEAHYTEQLIRLRNIHTYFQRPTVPDRLLERQHFGFTSHDHIYLCAQNPLKLHPDFDLVLGDILRQDPQGIVVFLRKKAHHVALVQERLTQTLPDVVQRIHWVAASSKQDYFSLLALADVCLDTPHYSGMNISYDTFAVETPLVTWPGDFMRGRYTTALYRKMDLADCVADTLAQVSEIARRIGTDRAYRHHLSGLIRQRSPVLFENEAVVAEFSRFFEAIWAKYNQS